MKQLKPLINTRTFYCETCGDKEGMNPPKFVEHLRAVHSLEKPFTGKKTGRLFMDMADGEYSNVYDWVLPGNVKVTECASGKRG